ncbi:zf-DNL-domain-containing protein [Coccomyxa subellipsoidea C-169]|uniref:Zf-DNL-domain-containing protein n=1 Tax=Coccomyxa subellipsoidea (strain C-169) TaxID=574566 RepID=I0ZA23_COCSC|nr:zf-DNL-domain-containing protein [Coccomyxa subellipsoidea C-169]EIE27492.1 zf-DNL-domain-containing protein [Coccomyxa subellipsoidea C-169]|eukprot:XP_005652036.1 zf-DNL-domain-containing protein [Coccomyxa subellipsoidea C-169]
MPNGVFWLDKEAHKHDIVYGQASVLVLPLPNGCVEALQRPQLGGVSLPAPFEQGFLDITDYRFMEEVEEDSHAADCAGNTAAALGPECTGIVLHSLFGGADQEDAQPPNKNPRRTRKVQFTCNLCGETTTKRVNPHAWENGTVFAECSGCRVKHKLIDNLKLFHELRGPVYPAAPMNPADIPASLPLRPLLDFQQHAGLLNMFHPEEM